MAELTGEQILGGILAAACGQVLEAMPNLPADTDEVGVLLLLAARIGEEHADAFYQAEPPIWYSPWHQQGDHNQEPPDDWELGKEPNE